MAQSGSISQTVRVVIQLHSSNSSFDIVEAFQDPRKKKYKIFVARSRNFSKYDTLRHLSPIHSASKASRRISPFQSYRAKGLRISFSTYLIDWKQEKQEVK